jgi:hypothetical protein
MYGMERTHNIAALDKHELMVRVEGDDCGLSRNYGGTTAQLQCMVWLVACVALVSSLTYAVPC